MADTLAEIRGALRAARQQRSWSQRALAAATGIPQAHLSGIESGKVDLRTSSLLELARALGLEVMLVPQKLVSAVESMSRHVGRSVAPGVSPATSQRPAYRLEEEDPDA